MKTNKLFIICAIVFAFLTSGLNAQFNIMDKLKNKSNQKVDQKTDNEIDKGINNTEKGVEGIFKKKKKDTDAKEFRPFRPAPWEGLVQARRSEARGSPAVVRGSSGRAARWPLRRVRRNARHPRR